MINFTFYGGHKQAVINIFFLFLDMSAVPKNSTAGKFAFFIISASPKWSNQVRLFQFKVAIGTHNVEM